MILFKLGINAILNKYIFILIFLSIVILIKLTYILFNQYHLSVITTSSILRIIFTSWVASRICDFLLCKLSITICFFISLVWALSEQLTPKKIIDQQIIHLWFDEKKVFQKSDVDYWIKILNKLFQKAEVVKFESP